jgi:glycine dehydrogenase subunit 2
VKEVLIFELSKAGRKAYSLPKIDIPQKSIKELIPQSYLRESSPELPELSELDIVRHFTRLSHLNYSVDTVMYPLGSCTMKYNPKVNEAVVQNEQWTNLHPYSPEKLSQGVLKMLYEMQKFLCEISGMDAGSLQPAAGAHGEFLGLLLIRAYHKEKGSHRTKVIVPDSSHGTNPSSAHIAGYEVITIPSNENGEVDLAALENVLDDNTAAVMLTNPNTVGIFEGNILKISELVHKKGALLYGDGANMNALLGTFRPGDIGFDVMHINLHKSFSTPHGGGGPGSGPVFVKKHLEPYLPLPVIEYKNGEYILQYDRPASIGKMHSFYGNVGVILRAYAYIRALGKQGIEKAGKLAVLNANYMRAKLKKHYNLHYDRKLCAHEFVMSSKKHKALDIAKRLLDYGFYAPTIYFPLIVHEAIMIEPTETESKDMLDKFIDTLIKIDEEDTEKVKHAPYNLPISRLDEVGAARNPDISWKK